MNEPMEADAPYGLPQDWAQQQLLDQEGHARFKFAEVAEIVSGLTGDKNMGTAVEKVLLLVCGIKD